MKWIYIILLCFFIGCITAPVTNSDIALTGNELQKMENDSNLTPVQQIVIAHAVVSLKDAVQAEKQNSALQDKVVSESKKAGAGTIVYWIIGIIGLGFISVVAIKILGKFP